SRSCRSHHQEVLKIATKERRPLEVAGDLRMRGWPAVDVPTLRALRSPDGRALLDEAVRAYGSESTLALGARLRRRHPPDLVAAALTQARLRARARDKLDPGDAERMFFTADGLEQATRAPVA